MPISYAEAIEIVREVAQARKQIGVTREETAPLVDAVGRLASRDVLSPISTPMFDSSAMDGYAVSSALTACASATRTLRLHVVGTIAAGDSPIRLACALDGEGRIPCVEVMTGAPFPQSTAGPDFDACIPWEHTCPMPLDCSRSGAIGITRLPKPNQNRRYAGHDFQNGDTILCRGVKIGPQHIMAMASVGIDTVAVQKRLGVVVMSTGCELQPVGRKPCDSALSWTFDCNGPFLSAALAGYGLHVESAGSVSDDIDELQASIINAISGDVCDILITTGGVSSGNFDFVPHVILELGGKVHFHHVAIRPGHPVLFASIPRRGGNNRARDVAVFGLPGNPIAAAACCRFLVIPYIHAMQGQPNELPQCTAKVLANSAAQCLRDGDAICRKDSRLDNFRHARLQRSGFENEVQISSEQSSAKVRPFGHANCWVHFPTGISVVNAGDSADCYSL